MSVDKHEKPAEKSLERREFITRAAVGAAAMAVGVMMLGCNGNSGSSPVTPFTSQPFTFAVITDIHVLDADLLGASGPAYQAYVASDPKMLNYSMDTLDVALSNIMNAKPSFVLIPGDLTKDGEYVDHLVVAGKLSVLVASGIPVYVVPGNHDINNPAAVSYLDQGASGTPVPHITPAQFQSIYAPYGYTSALYKDPNSLSYIAEPVPGLWLFAIDSCEYADNIANGSPTTAGQIGQATLSWIQSYLAKAKSMGKVVIGMEHHLAMEHFQGQDQFFPDFILSNYQTAGAALAAAGLNLIFTGHFHANDVAQTTYSDGSVLTDVSTGATVIAPCPYRMVTANLTSRTFQIATQTVADIPEYPTAAQWQGYENQFILTGMTGVAQAMLQGAPFNVDATDAAGLAPVFGASMAAFYAGNPTFANAPAQVQQTIQGLLASSNPQQVELGKAIMAIWKPGATLDDNNLTITLA